jgi:hypothetical protein
LRVQMYCYFLKYQNIPLKCRKILYSFVFVLLFLDLTGFRNLLGLLTLPINQVLHFVAISYKLLAISN